MGHRVCSGDNLLSDSTFSHSQVMVVPLGIYCTDWSYTILSLSSLAGLGRRYILVAFTSWFAIS